LETLSISRKWSGSIPNILAGIKVVSGVASGTRLKGGVQIGLTLQGKRVYMGLPCICDLLAGRIRQGDYEARDTGPPRSANLSAFRGPPGQPLTGNG